MTDSEILIYNKTTITTVERYAIRELAKSFMMYKVSVRQVTTVITFKHN